MLIFYQVQWYLKIFGFFNHSTLFIFAFLCEIWRALKIHYIYVIFYNIIDELKQLSYYIVSFLLS